MHQHVLEAHATNMERAIRNAVDEFCERIAELNPTREFVWRLNPESLAKGIVTSTLTINLEFAAAR